MDVFHRVGTGEAQQVVEPAHRAAPLKDEILLLQSQALDERAGGSVQHQDAPGEMLGEVFCLVFHIGQRYGICGKCGNKTPADDGISAKKSSLQIEKEKR